MGAVRSMFTASAKRWRASIWRCYRVLATFLGSDPITVGATPEQKKIWLTRIAEEDCCSPTEPLSEAGSDLGALRTTADRVTENDRVVGYKVNGAKQWISNGGIADAYTVLANTPSGPSWFIVEKDTKGFTHDEPEDKHGIRLSNTRRLRSTMFMSTLTGSSAASKARD